MNEGTEKRIITNQRFRAYQKRLEETELKTCYGSEGNLICNIEKLYELKIEKGHFT